jgi:hypothetical protein
MEKGLRVGIILQTVGQRRVVVVVFLVMHLRLFNLFKLDLDMTILLQFRLLYCDDVS